MSFNAENWHQLNTTPEIPEGKFGMVLVLRRTVNSDGSPLIIESGMVHHSKAWAPVHPVILEQLNKLESPVQFADIRQEYPDCPVTEPEVPKDQDAYEGNIEKVIESVLRAEIPAQSKGSTLSNPSAKAPESSDKILEWLQKLPVGQNITAFLTLEDKTMVFTKSNWHDLPGFISGVGPYNSGELTIGITYPDSTQKVSGLLLEGTWMMLAPEYSETEFKAKFPNAQEFTLFTELFPDCPVTRNAD